jgi:hypothetical protein
VHELFGVRTGAEQGDQGIMQCHPNIVSPAGNRRRRCLPEPR